ncbi:MAG: CHRD domain-containing protein [Nocardioidaceae bacterium]
MTASLNGLKEVPNGDRNGTAHIHRGRAGVNGDVVVDLTGSVTDGANCARGVRKALIRKIIEHPRRFYFNIHNRAYPAGAIRGQLHN